MFQRYQLSNLAIEPGLIQDSLLVSPEQCGRPEHKQFLHQLKGLPTRWKDKEGQESSQEGTHVELESVPNHQDTNISHGHTQTIVDEHSTLKPMHTLHAPHIQTKDLKTSENHKEPRMKRSQTTQHKNTKPQNHKNNNNNNKNSHHWQLSYRSPYAKPAKNAWEVLIDDTQAVNEETMETYHQHLLKVADQPQNIHTSKPEKKN